MFGRRRERRRERELLKIRHFERLLVLTPTQFEHEVAALLRELGFRKAVVSGRAGDLSADIKARDERGQSVIVQCKRYAPSRSVGSPEIQKFIGMATTHHEADRMLYVTTARFSRAAIELARKHKVELVDGARLAELLAEARGLPEKPTYVTINEFLMSGVSAEDAHKMVARQEERLREELQHAREVGCQCTTRTRHWQLDGDAWNAYRQFVVSCPACGRFVTREEIEELRPDLEKQVASDPHARPLLRRPRSQRS
jgi:hypothetical protein